MADKFLKQKDKALNLHKIYKLTMFMFSRSYLVNGILSLMDCFTILTLSAAVRQTLVHADKVVPVLITLSVLDLPAFTVVGVIVEERSFSSVSARCTAETKVANIHLCNRKFTPVITLPRSSFGFDSKFGYISQYLTHTHRRKLKCIVK